MNMESRIFLSFPHIGGTEMNWIEEAFKGSWVLPLGPNVDEFEKRLSRCYKQGSRFFDRKTV